MEKIEKPLEIEPLYLPPEIQQEILTWVPGKSLVRFQATCKLWNSWMHDSAFAKMHFDRGGHRYRCIIYFVQVDGVSHMETLDESMQPPPKILRINLQSLPKPIHFNYKISDSCNGIVCIYNGDCDNNIVLYNPLTRESVLLPKPSMLIAHGVKHSRYQAVYIGFVPSMDEYKIVRIFNDNSSKLFGHCAVFSLSSWSWKKISDIKIPISVSPILANGVMFWRSYSNNSVLWLDLATDQSGIIDPPPHTIMPDMMSLSEVEGSLVFVFLYWSDEDYMSIWKLQDVARGVWMRCALVCNPIYVPVSMVCNPIYVPAVSKFDSCLWDDVILDQGRTSFALGNKLFFVSILGDSQEVYHLHRNGEYFDEVVKRRDMRVQPNLHVHSLLSLKKYVPSN